MGFPAPADAVAGSPLEGFLFTAPPASPPAGTDTVTFILLSERFFFAGAAAAGAGAGAGAGSGTSSAAPASSSWTTKHVDRELPASLNVYKGVKPRRSGDTMSASDHTCKHERGRDQGASEHPSRQNTHTHTSTMPWGSDVMSTPSRASWPRFRTRNLWGVTTSFTSLGGGRRSYSHKQHHSQGAPLTSRSPPPTQIVLIHQQRR